MKTRSGRPEVGVLVVDDDPAITDVLQFALQADFSVRQSQSVEAALFAVRRQPPAVIVTDLHMDDGGGEHILASVAFSHPEVVRIVHSSDSPRDLEWLVDSGLAHAVVQKTGRPDAVKRLLGELLFGWMAAAAPACSR